MKKTNAYTISFEDKTITMTRDFAKRAGIINSDEYNLFTQFRKDYSDYKIEVRTATKNANKNTHKGLTIDFMKKVIAAQKNATDAKAEFERVTDFYEGQPAYYAKVKAWFLAKYPNYDIYAPVEPAQNTDIAPLGIAG